MTYIRLDHAVTFFIIYIIVSMVREFQLRTRLERQDYTQGCKDAVKEIADKWNELYSGVSTLTFVTKMHKYLQSKLNGGG